jgi:hypothetical protein
MPVEFVNLTPNSAPGTSEGLLGRLDQAFIRRYARTIEDWERQ